LNSLRRRRAILAAGAPAPQERTLTTPQTTDGLATAAARPTIAPAATLLLLRDCDSGVEVLMMRRQVALRFMGGMWVFPGGRVDPSDCGPGAALVVDHADDRGTVPCAPDGTPLPADLALGLKVATCRETYEEAGVLLVRHPDGRTPAPEQLRELAAQRENVAHTADGFIAMVASSGLLLDVHRLVYWSHWITPSHESRRFDTHFFALAMPEDQVARLDERESTELAWLTPRDAGAAAARGTMLLAPPTQITLEDLGEAHARHGNVSAMLAAERGRATPPVMPRIRVEGATTHVLMPWNPEYAQAQGEGYISPTGYPPHLTRRPASLVFRRAAAQR
jgi:8-oxo-dGTP pyrophosphatase MutT (NUDIX family)